MIKAIELTPVLKQNANAIGENMGKRLAFALEAVRGRFELSIGTVEDLVICEIIRDEIRGGSL